MIVAAHRTSVSRERRAEFERRFAGSLKLNDMTRGFIRNEFLKPLSGNHYIVLSYWESREDFETWRKSQAGGDLFASGDLPGRTAAPGSLELHEVIGISERVMEADD